MPDYQLSLAIGKEGQNARLAARLTGWRIDIRSDEADGAPRWRRRSAPEPPADARLTGSDRAVRRVRLADGSSLPALMTAPEDADR